MPPRRKYEKCKKIERERERGIERKREKLGIREIMAEIYICASICNITLNQPPELSLRGSAEEVDGFGSANRTRRKSNWDAPCVFLELSANNELLLMLDGGNSREGTLHQLYNHRRRRYKSYRLLSVS